MIKTEICELLDIKYPIIQAPMGPFDTKDLAVAVADAGGFGIVSHPVPDPDDDHPVHPRSRRHPDGRV